MTEREWCYICNDSKSDILFISLFSVRSRSSSQTHRARKVNLASLANLLPAALASRRASAAGRLQVLSQNSTEEHTEKPANPEPPQFSGDTAQFLSHQILKHPWEVLCQSPRLLLPPGHQVHMMLHSCRSQATTPRPTPPSKQQRVVKGKK